MTNNMRCCLSLPFLPLFLTWNEHLYSGMSHLLNMHFDWLDKRHGWKQNDRHDVICLTVDEHVRWKLSIFNFHLYIVLRVTNVKISVLLSKKKEATCNHRFPYLFIVESLENSLVPISWKSPTPKNSNIFEKFPKVFFPQLLTMPWPVCNFRSTFPESLCPNKDFNFQLKPVIRCSDVLITGRQTYFQKTNFCSLNV